jgi:hypothetical protein
MQAARHWLSIFAITEWVYAIYRFTHLHHRAIPIRFQPLMSMPNASRQHAHARHFTPASYKKQGDSVIPREHNFRVLLPLQKNRHAPR